MLGCEIGSNSVEFPAGGKFLLRIDGYYEVSQSHKTNHRRIRNIQKEVYMNINSYYFDFTTIYLQIHSINPHKNIKHNKEHNNQITETPTFSYTHKTRISYQQHSPPQKQ